MFSGGRQQRGKHYNKTLISGIEHSTDTFTFENRRVATYVMLTYGSFHTWSQCECLYWRLSVRRCFWCTGLSSWGESEIDWLINPGFIIFTNNSNQQTNRYFIFGWSWFYRGYTFDKNLQYSLSYLGLKISLFLYQPLWFYSTHLVFKNCIIFIFYSLCKDSGNRANLFLIYIHCLCCIP